jgi:hypothetical protein
MAMRSKFDAAQTFLIDVGLMVACQPRYAQKSRG